MRTQQDLKNCNVAYTPLKLENWKTRLMGFEECADIIQGINSGFRLGVQDKEVLRSSEGSHRSKDLWEVTNKEVTN